jgi:hypothetical protein
MISGLHRRDNDVACVRIASRFPRRGDRVPESWYQCTTTIRLLVVVGTDNQKTSTDCRHTAQRVTTAPSFSLRSGRPLSLSRLCHNLDVRLLLAIRDQVWVFLFLIRYDSSCT